MDTFSAITGIAPLCVTSAGLLVSFYQYINDVGEVPRYVEELTSELCSLNTGLAQLKRLVLNRKKSNKDFLEQWAKDSKMILDNCCETLEQINRMIQKAKIETKSSSKGQVMRCMKWLWNKNEVILMRDRLERYKSTISMMLQSLSR